MSRDEAARQRRGGIATLLALAALVALLASPSFSYGDRICYFCNQAIRDGADYQTVKSLQTGRDEYYHEECYPRNPSAAPQCAICTLFTGEKFLSTAKGLPLCRYCQPYAITDEKAIDAILVDIRYICYKKFGIVTYYKPELQLLDYVTFHKRFKQNMAFANYRRDANPDVLRTITSIYVVRGYSRNGYYRYLSHEYGHAWHADYPDISGEIREGFGEWLAYTICKMKNIHPVVSHYEESLKDERYCNSPYGMGLRMFLDAEKKGGVKAVLELAGK